MIDGINTFSLFSAERCSELRTIYPSIFKNREQVKLSPLRMINIAKLVNSLKNVIFSRFSSLSRSPGLP